MSIPTYIVLEKSVGRTPLEAIQEWRLLNTEYKDVPATYAGRLDPMAHGKLLVLLGEECKRQDRYRGLDKEYEVEIVLGISTDTGDALGVSSVSNTLSSLGEEQVQMALKKLTGTHTVPYPAFSSKTVNGKPLFMYALEGDLSNISVPTHAETIHKIDLIETTSISGTELQSLIQDHLSHVPRSDEPSKVLGADFRQDEIRAQWEQTFSELSNEPLTVLALRVTCASGTYMRTLAKRLGEELGTSGFALSIHRTRIGRYQKIGPLGFWRKEYR